MAKEGSFTADRSFTALHRRAREVNWTWSARKASRQRSSGRADREKWWWEAHFGRVSSRREWAGGRNLGSTWLEIQASNVSTMHLRPVANRSPPQAGRILGHLLLLHAPRIRSPDSGRLCASPLDACCRCWAQHLKYDVEAGVQERVLDQIFTATHFHSSEAT